MQRIKVWNDFSIILKFLKSDNHSPSGNVVKMLAYKHWNPVMAQY